MRVFLIHGMGRSRASMRLLAARLRRSGHAPSSFGYWVSRDPVDAIVDALLAHIAARRERDLSAGGEGEYAIIGHSLGNILTRLASERLPAGFARFAMLAPPNRPPLLARRLSRNPLFRALTGEAGQRLADPAFYAALPVPDVPTLIFAGDGGPRAAFLPFGHEPSDGVVGVEETRLDGVPHVVVPAVHTFIMNDREVTRRLLAFLTEAPAALSAVGCSLRRG